MTGLAIVITLVTSCIIPLWGCENAPAEILRIFATRSGVEVPVAIEPSDDGVWLEAEVRD